MLCDTSHSSLSYKHSCVHVWEPWAEIFPQNVMPVWKILQACLANENFVIMKRQDAINPGSNCLGLSFVLFRVIDQPYPCLSGTFCNTLGGRPLLWPRARAKNDITQQLKPTAEISSLAVVCCGGLNLALSLLWCWVRRGFLEEAHPWSELWELIALPPPDCSFCFMLLAEDTLSQLHAFSCWCPPEPWGHPLFLHHLGQGWLSQKQDVTETPACLMFPQTYF